MAYLDRKYRSCNFDLDRYRKLFDDDFVPEYHAKFGSESTTNAGDT